MISNHWYSIVIFIFCMKMDPSWAQKNFEPQTLRIYEDNDLINLRQKSNDRYYTNGTRIDILYTKPNKDQKFLSALLLDINENANNLFGIGITQLMFTPSDISKTDITSGERPYAGLLFFNHSLSSSDSKNNQKLFTEINLGVIGSMSFARQTQTTIHQIINAQKPLGWDHQVKNDIILNYNIQYEKLLVNPSDNFQIIGLIGADAGTLYNQITAGLTFRAGKYNSYFSNYEKAVNPDNLNSKETYKKFQFFFYMKPIVTAFMDSSTLQGGMFTGRDSDYTIKSDDLTHYYMQFEYGFIIGTKRFGLSINQKLRTAEFKNATNIQVGNLTLFIGL